MPPLRLQRRDEVDACEEPPERDLGVGREAVELVDEQRAARLAMFPLGLAVVPGEAVDRPAVIAVNDEEALPAVAGHTGHPEVGSPHDRAAPDLAGLDPAPRLE